MKTSFSILIMFIVFLNLPGQICVGTSEQIKWEVWQEVHHDEISNLQAAYNYPTRPFKTQTIYKTTTPYNYDNYIGGRIRGYINLPETTDVTFNVTGNSKVFLYLSTDEEPANMELIAEAPEYTNLEEHDKYPEQTSNLITLTANVNYYFEMLYVENTGTDFASIYWKNPLVEPDEWRLITDDYLKDVGCIEDDCLPEGTPCDDGDPTTIDDIEDGFCHCIGIKDTNNSCIGDRGQLHVYRYDSIPGSYLNDLYEAPSFPGTPNYSEALDFFGKIWVNNEDDSGTLVQGYMTVPVTGNYKFNVTGDDNTILFISSDEDPENKQAHQCFVSSWTNMTEHDKFIWQSTSNIYLESGKYYYIETNHKNGGGNTHYSAFWQTPYTTPGQWKRIPSIYMYDYNCEIACIEEGTPCDDGDPFTNDDAYDENCNCTGIPCIAEDCDSPLASYIPYDKCAVTDQIDNNESNNWLSCEITPNPNTLYGDGHWIMYDLGARHELYETHFWNYNVLGETDKGFESVTIDYSIDGISWSNFGNYNWPLATGDSGYSGFSGPDLLGTYARYILISSLDGGTCRGIGKSAFTAVLCPLAGTVCDDLDKYTVDDRYDTNCECIGTPIDVNDCLEESITLGDSIIYNAKHSAELDVNSISQIAEDNVVGFVGGKSVVLDVGFEAGPNSIFIASIDPCEEERAIQAAIIETRAQKIRERQEATENDKLEGLQVLPKDKEYQIIKYYLPKGGNAKVEILDGEQSLYTLIDHEYLNAGVYSKVIRTKRIKSGVYQVRLTTDDIVENERLIVN